jgi:hypothetical protein
MQLDSAVELIFRHAWILAVLVTCANGASWWYRGRQPMAENPALQPGYRRLIRSFLIYENLPWLVMGAGVLFGRVPSVFHYFDPRGGGPFVIAFWVTVAILWIATCRWLFRGGAEELVAHPGLLNVEVGPRAIKLLFLLALAGGVSALLMMIFGVFPIAR